MDGDLCQQGRRVQQEAFDAPEIRYDSFPPSKKRGRSLLAAGPRIPVGGALLDDPEHDKPARGAGTLGAGARVAVAGPPAGGAWRSVAQ